MARRVVAACVKVPYEAITTVVMGDTDRTPDGGFSAGFLEYGGQNLRKAAAYTYQAILDLASTTLGVHKNQLSEIDGVSCNSRAPGFCDPLPEIREQIERWRKSLGHENRRDTGLRIVEP
jgi:hypothetical protein